MSLTMTPTEREAFLADLHVGILSVADQGGRPPLSVPIWYMYEPGGGLSFITGRGSRKVPLIRSAGGFTVCVQTEVQPYRYVTVEGSLTVVEDTSDADRRAMADRYLGREEGGRYFASTPPDEVRESVTIRMRPERWLTADFSRQQR
ncbi:MAG TPA: pyridoxamine 5'-phosphate oxidase family protein [Candidatus Dormibacteraeota bacterium]|nr:pyridoxamine 5'-phosphate oxidase family protein [Candidatus Dormibacteraeota bacterium]